MVNKLDAESIKEKPDSTPDPDEDGVWLDGCFIKESDEGFKCALAVLGARRVHKNFNE